MNNLAFSSAVAASVFPVDSCGGSDTRTQEDAESTDFEIRKGRH